MMIAITTTPITMIQTIMMTIIIDWSPCPWGEIRNPSVYCT
jgi:hypothetical protein